MLCVHEGLDGIVREGAIFVVPQFMIQIYFKIYILFSIVIVNHNNESM